MIGYISHQSNTNTYTLAFSSPTTEDLLELLASVSPNIEYLTPLPTSIFSTSYRRTGGSIYSPYLPYLAIVTEATDALNQLLPHRPSYLSSALRSLVSFLGYSPSAMTEGSESEPRVEITGHGLGAVSAFLSSVRQSAQYPDMDIRGTFFSMPLVGDPNFAASVDRLVLARGGQLKLERATNGMDPVPSLPPPHFGLQHPSSISERYIESGVRVEGGSGKMERGTSRSRLDDAYGPYDGVMIGLSC